MTEPSDDLVDALRQMPRDAVPPANLEAATVARLRDAGLLGRRPVWRGFLVAAGLLLAFGLGRWSVAPASTTPTVSTGPTWALMLYDGATPDTADHATRAAEYSAWARAAHQDAEVVGGEALGAAGAPLPGGDALPARGEPVGFFLVRAPSRDAATQLARTCPHLKYGGTIVVREVLPT